MKSISTATCESIISLLCSGYSTRQIQSKLGVSKSIVSNVSKIYEINKENIKFGCPRKLSAIDQQAVLTLVRTGKAGTAFAAVKHINSIIRNLSQSKPSGMCSRKMGTSPMQRRNCLFSLPSTVRPDWLLLKNTKTGQWKTGSMSFGQMRPKSINLGQMGASIAGRSLENHWKTGRWRQLSNFGEVVSWFGAAWGGMGLGLFVRLRKRWMPNSMSTFWRMVFWKALEIWKFQEGN